MQIHYFQSPIGILRLATEGDYLVEIRFSGKNEENTAGHPVLDRAAEQLSEYFVGARTEFDLPLKPEGSDFQKKVWDSLLTIPYGSTLTYMDLAKKLGDKNVIRAAGRANGQNPIPIIIPCHRVVGSNGHLTGYSGGIERKRWLLQHEGALLL